MPQLLGSVAADPAHAQDFVAATHLQGLASLLHGELGQVSESAARAGKRIVTRSMETKLRFRSAKERKKFAEELQHALLGVVSRHADAYEDGEGSSAPGRPFRPVVGYYPIPAKESVKLPKYLEAPDE